MRQWNRILNPRLMSGATIVIVSLLVFSCARTSGPPVAEKPRIFRGEWFDYYNRALWHLQEGRNEEAAKDLDRALQNQDADSWDTRTYGVHFIEYFPHREKGILLHLSGRPEEAESELLKSWQQSPSSRGMFYLNRVRRERLLASGGDTVPPGLQMDGIRDGLVTREPSLSVRGRAIDDRYVAQITFEGEPFFMELAEPEIQFEQSIPLVPGPNTIHVIAEDLAGNRTESDYNIYMDREPPLLAIQEIRREPDALVVRATVRDAGGLARMELDGKSQPLDGTETWSLERRVPLSEQSRGLPFTVEDRAGNLLRSAMDLTTPSRVAQAGPEPGLFNSENSILSDAPRSPLLAEADPAGIDEPPVITLPGLEEDTLTLFMDRIYIDGRIRAPARLDRVNINGRKLPPIDAIDLYFGEIIDLQEATNTITLSASDKKGRIIERILTVNRVIPEALSIGSRLALTVSPMEYTPDAAAYEPAIEQSFLNPFLAARRFRLLDRQNLEALLLERRLSLTALAEPSTAASVARQQEADLIMTGSVRYRPQTKGLEIVGRWIDSQTSRVLFIHDVYGENLDPASLERMLEGLYLKFGRHFPLVSGTVTQSSRKELQIASDHAALLREGMEFIVYREGEELFNPKTRQSLGRTATLLAQGAIAGTNLDTATLRLEQSPEGGAVQPGDKVIAK